MLLHAPFARITGSVKGRKPVVLASQPGAPSSPALLIPPTTVLVMRLWTVEEARAYLPRLRELVGTIREAALIRAGKWPSANGERSPMIDAQEAYEELQEGDIILRDATTGLIDFHAQGDDGVVYYLCWRWGEPELAWWHLPEEGFPGRKPLPRETA
jgi:hypothetical protein